MQTKDTAERASDVPLRRNFIERCRRTLFGKQLYLDVPTLCCILRDERRTRIVRTTRLAPHLGPPIFFPAPSTHSLGGGRGGGGVGVDGVVSAAGDRYRLAYILIDELIHLRNRRAWYEYDVLGSEHDVILGMTSQYAGHIDSPGHGFILLAPVNHEHLARVRRGFEAVCEQYRL